MRCRQWRLTIFVDRASDADRHSFDLCSSGKKMGGFNYFRKPLLVGGDCVDNERFVEFLKITGARDTRLRTSNIGDDEHRLGFDFRYSAEILGSDLRVEGIAYERGSAISLYYYLRVVVFMYLKKEIVGSEPTMSPALTLALAVAVAATLVLGVYPRLLFEAAEVSARTLGVGGVAAIIR